LTKKSTKRKRALTHIGLVSASEAANIKKML